MPHTSPQPNPPERLSLLTGPAPSRILIVRPSALGDVCRTVPVLVSLKRAFPSAEIDWLVQDAFAPAVANHPGLARVVPFARARFAGGRWLIPSVGRELWRFLLSIRRARYDLVLDCQGLARSALFTWASGAAVRVGFANAAELGWLALNRRVKAPRAMHTVDRMLRLAQAAGCSPIPDLRLYSAPRDREAVSGYGLGSGGFAVLAPTSRWPGKLWPGDRFAQLAKAVLDDPVLGIGQVAFLGGAGEHDQCIALRELAARDSRVVDLVGRTSVGQMMAVIEEARIVIGNDSAAVHIAVGFDRPLVALYGPTRAERVGPYGRPQDVVQKIEPGDRFSHKDAVLSARMMQRITVDDVLERVRSQLSKSVTLRPAVIRTSPASAGA